MTIEERAYNAYPTFTAENVDLVNTARGGYIKGATEQQIIDIDKACELMITMLNDGTIETSDIGKVNTIIRNKLS